MSGSCDVAVVGGGIAGLAAARELARTGFSVRLLEASPRLGGKLAAGSLAGLVVDVGAESVLVRRPEATALISDLGLGDRLVHPTGATPRIYVDGKAVSLPPSAMGVPTDISALAELLTREGLATASREPAQPAPRLDSDVSIGRLIDQRFGAEVTDRLLEPLLGGVYAGHARELSFAAVHPALFASAAGGGPLSQHAAALRRPPTGSVPNGSARSGPVFGGLTGGVNQLATALADDLERQGVEICRSATVRGLARTASGYRLTVGSARAPEQLTASAVVLATPARPTARLLAELPELTTIGSRLGQIPYASTALVVLAISGVQPVGSGLLVPPGQLPTVKAVTHSSQKWAWLAAAGAEHFGAGIELVRASIGRVGEESLLQISDDQLIARTVAELATLPGWSQLKPVAGLVQRWGGGLPQYLVGHLELVRQLRDDLDRLPGLAVCGAAYDGVGIAACIGSAGAAAAKVVGDLGLQAGTTNES